MPKSFLVKKVLWNRKKPDLDPDDQPDSKRSPNEEREERERLALETEPDDDAVHSETKLSSSRSSSSCGSISASSTISNVDSGFFSGNEFSYTRGFPDTYGLHTLAELCLHRADMELESQNSGKRLAEEIVPFKFSAGVISDSQKKRNKRAKRCETSAEIRDVVAFEDDSGKNSTQGVKVEQNNEPAQNMLHNEIKSGTGSRLHKLEEELKKMLHFSIHRGREDIIGREMKEFMENNKLLIKDIARDTGLSTTEVSKFLTEGLHMKDEKRRKLFTWYLERKLTHPVNPEDESFTCYKCGKIFAYESYLARHVKYVCPDKTGRTWKCSYCSKAFQYPCYLRRHMRSHTGESPYKCNQCSRAFVRSTDLQRHLRNHTGEKPYKCQECSRAFARSTDLKRHFRTHTGEKPYKCWQCSKAFSQSGSLQTHLHTHYKESLQVKGVIPSRIKNITI